MVAAVTLGWLSMLEAALLAAGLMIITPCTEGRVARQAPDWVVLVVIATSFGVGAALEKTGAASLIAGELIGLAGGDPRPTLALVYLATTNVAAVPVFPIVMQAAQTRGCAPEPFLVTRMLTASASFATPIGYQSNLMVYNLGGHRFSDFLRVGLPLTFLVGMVTVGLVPLTWDLQR